MRTKFTKSLLFLFTLIAPFAYAQELQVSGTVTSSEDGLSMPGVSIIVVGTQTGTSTDFDGNFSIIAEQGQTLQFNFIGYADKEVKITGSSMNVVMDPDANVLDEVIVAGVAAGTSKKKLSVSVAKVGE
ncbi:MAG: carboxypeptidase-like regulatory domain-containing protein, partial [Bacteroidota bacterium]